MKHGLHISGSPGSERQFGTRARRLVAAAGLWLIAVLTLGLIHAAHAEVLDVEEFRYRRLMEHAEAAGYELSAERQIDNAGKFGFIRTASDPAGANLYLEFNEDQYLIESLDSM